MATTIAQEPLKSQIWVLKVSIHCEGCKRKVKRVLHNIDGVYNTTIDSQQHKVTVTTGDMIDAKTLINKLTKTGKHAELWPEKKPGNSLCEADGAVKKKKGGKKKGKKSQKSNNDSNPVETSITAAVESDVGSNTPLDQVNLTPISHPSYSYPSCGLSPYRPAVFDMSYNMAHPNRVSHYVTHPMTAYMCTDTTIPKTYFTPAAPAVYLYDSYNDEEHGCSIM
ncbi:hypothetical protein GIB67_039476 [Kingdonia uniflora]|uniref:HMA domain-containing protein n=1 Tax=Kingdonia uniflora TaxID=39325 RepID=A0A7J7LIY6_9MAGN|nr:hypothetical protein GIB67_039476 [Kingdonia uniflora]